jgi:hypothetical protein
MIDGGFYLAFNEKMLRDVIDQAEARHKGKPATVAVNSSLYLAPAAAEHAGKLLRRYLESQTQRQSLANEPIWYVLYRAGLIAPDTAPAKARGAAYHYFGFVPVSPDEAAYRHEAKTDEVVNVRHGSLRRPKPHTDLEKNAPLTQLLEQLRTVRADLRFRADGIHTVLTLQRQKPTK